jgi:hypothetical protein
MTLTPTLSQGRGGNKKARTSRAFLDEKGAARYEIVSKTPVVGGLITAALSIADLGFMPPSYQAGRFSAWARMLGSVDGSSGFTRWLSKPALNDLRRSSSVPYPESAMM